MSDCPDRPPADLSSPFAWVWDDLVPKASGTMPVLYDTNRGTVELYVRRLEPLTWIWFPRYSHAIRCAIALRFGIVQ